MESEAEEELNELDEEQNNISLDDEQDEYVELNEEESIYSGDGPTKMLDDDELSPEEEAFMKGYINEQAMHLGLQLIIAVEFNNRIFIVITD